MTTLGKLSDRINTLREKLSKRAPTADYSLPLGTAFRLLGLAATIASACVPGAEAQSNETVRFEQRSLYPTARGGWTSHQGSRGQVEEFGFQTYDDFSFTSGEVLTRFQWSGFYRDNENLANNPALPNTREWTITIHEDEGGQPGMRVH